MSGGNLKNNSKIKRITLAAVFAAAVFAATSFTAIPIPRGFINLGDSVIFLAAHLLGGPLAACAAAAGSAIADVYLGYTVYAPATFVIKGLMAFSAGYISKRGTLPSYICAAAACGAIMAAGYFVYEFIVFGGAVAMTDLPGNLIQGAGNIAVSAIICPAAARIKRAARI